MVSVMIPARNEEYLEKTLLSLLANARGEIEVIAVLDGYLPDPPIKVACKPDQKVIWIHNPTALGQRHAVNQAAEMAKGDFVFKVDAHCAFDEGFDVKLAENCEYQDTIIPRMYGLEAETWKPKIHRLTDYMFFLPNLKVMFYHTDKETMKRYTSAQPDRRDHSRRSLPLDETMAHIGAGWFMHRERFWELGGMDEAHGSWGQMGVEVACKAWLSGGRHLVNRTTWFAHMWRRGAPYAMSGEQQERAREYSRDLWLNNRWPQQIRPLEWLIDKFDPPEWDKWVEPEAVDTALTIEELRGKHTGETCWIVGAAPSIANLTAADVGPGPVIVLNEALRRVRELNLPNLIYSMQKDGGDKSKCPNCADGCGVMVKPIDETLLIHSHPKESRYCFKDHTPRYSFEAATLCDMNHGRKEFSANVALKVAQVFGCAKIKLVGCSDCLHGENRSIAGDATSKYMRQVVRMREMIAKDGIDVEWVGA